MIDHEYGVARQLAQADREPPLEGILPETEVKLAVLSSDTAADAYGQNCRMNFKNGEKTVLLVMCTDRGIDRHLSALQIGSDISSWQRFW